MKGIKIELLGIATILLGIAVTTNNFFGYVLGFLGFGVAIEIFQYMTRLGSFDIDDIILNMVGVLSGYGTFGLVNHVLLKER